MAATVQIKATDLDDAIEKAADVPLPAGSYEDGSFQVDEDFARDRYGNVTRSLPRRRR